MRKVFERVTDRLREFVAQRDDLALVVRSSAGESSTILQLLETLEEESTFAMFCSFPEPFGDAEGYAAALVESFAPRHELVRQLQIQEGMKVWPQFPPALLEGAMPPAQRLRELMVFARSLLPAPDGAVLVWAMFPAEIVDRAGYARLMAELLRHEFPFPWCHHLRIVLRDDAADPALAKTLGKPPRIAWYEPDLSPQALEKALEEEVADEKLPLDDRMQALLVTAATDYSHKRYPLALEKYQLLFQHFSAQGNLVLAAVALNGMGEVYRETGKKDEAGACFEAALVPATDGQEPPVPVMLTASLNLANLRMEQKRYAEAEAYYDCVQRLATAMRNAELKIQGLEHLGQARYLQEKVPEALESWHAGVTVAVKLEKPELGQGVLERLRKHYKKVRDSAKLQEVEEQLATAKS